MKTPHDIDDTLADLVGDPPGDQDLISAPELADLLGVTTRALSDLHKTGVVEKAGVGKYRLRASVRAYCRHVRENTKSGHANDPALKAEKIRLTKAQADREEIKNRQARGALVDAKAVEREWSDILRHVRAAVLAVPSRVQTRLPHLTAHDVSEIDAELREALRSAAEDVPHPTPSEPSKRRSAARETPGKNTSEAGHG